MSSLRRQRGWYNGALMMALVLVLVLFMAQPWIPLLLLAALGSAAVVTFTMRGGSFLKEWYRQHHPHLH
ncbi:hypothetical protein [Vogesella sp. LIG4]|uniref:hypothetical protein n=1 Tax=Vogesella sp. LIG4 TaxID=1192162 RepID=UPI00081F9FE0|nr:hypothetical protein [Vogesella sp. LIG4]SCK19382.1 hypothetical protein PSELUDRAFT_2123 [Vogesella sp. LIG4]